MVINKEEGYAYINVFQVMNMSAIEWYTVPTITMIIMVITFITSLIFQTTNRVVINHFIGWDNYRAMQKEASDFRKEQMAAARSKDQKQLEKIKKKQSHINAINAKMMKFQFVQMALTLCYLPIWTFLGPYLTKAQINGISSVIVVPGIGVVTGFSIGPLLISPYMIWFMISGFFTGALVMRILGTTPVT
jgi:uncharacterized membrane protein (DUF106 family)